MGSKPKCGRSALRQAGSRAFEALRYDRIGLKVGRIFSRRAPELCLRRPRPAAQPTASKRAPR